MRHTYFLYNREHLKLSCHVRISKQHISDVFTHCLKFWHCNRLSCMILCITVTIHCSVLHEREGIKMADENKTLKPKSFRISEEVANKFKEIANSINGNQQDTMQLLINAYYMQEQKGQLTEHKADIEQFEAYATSMISMFTKALQSNHDMRETVMTEFEALLQSKDDVIQDLQSKLKVAQDLKADAVEKAKQYVNENNDLTKELEEIKADREAKVNDLNSMLNDKEQLNKALTDSCNDLKEKVESMTAECKEIAEIRTQLADITAENDKLMKDKSKLEKEFTDREKDHKVDKDTALKQREAELKVEHDKAILNLEKKYQDVIQTLKDEKAKQIDEYQTKYLELLERINSEAGR